MSAGVTGLWCIPFFCRCPRQWHFALWTINICRSIQYMYSDFFFKLTVRFFLLFAENLTLSINEKNLTWRHYTSKESRRTHQPKRHDKRSKVKNNLWNNENISSLNFNQILYSLISLFNFFFSDFKSYQSCLGYETKRKWNIFIGMTEIICMVCFNVILLFFYNLCLIFNHFR